MDIALLNGHIPVDTQALIDMGEIREDFHYKSEWKFEGRLKDELVGLIAYTKGKFEDGTIVPQFVHVLIAKKYRGKDEARKLLKLTETHLKRSGYSQVFAYIKNDRKYMQRSAVHHGYKSWSSDEDGKFFYKNI